MKMLVLLLQPLKRSGILFSKNQFDVKVLYVIVNFIRDLLFLICSFGAGVEN